MDSMIPTSLSTRTASRRVALAALLLLATLPGVAMAGSAGFKHEFVMRGQVLELNAGTLVVCVGDQDGAQVGQVLNVVRHVRTAGAPKQVGPRYRRQAIGSIKITGLFDGHYADATVVQGKPQVNDTVELASK